MTSSAPNIYGLKCASILYKLFSLCLYGYSKDEVIQIVFKAPSILTYSLSKINDNVNTIINLGYSKTQALSIIYMYPGILTNSNEKIKEKINFYKDNNIEFIVCNDSRQLIQSIELTYARLEFFKNNGIIINNLNYRKLYITNQKFLKQYKITKDELIKQYSYKYRQ